MKLNQSFAIAAVLVVMTIPAAGWENPPDHEFTATAVMTTSQGTRSMPVTFIARSYTSIDRARSLEEVLANGGQGALLATLKGMNDGRIRLGALEMPVSLVAAEEISDGYRYFFITARRLHVEEVNSSSPSLDYPFGVAVFELGDFGTGDGEIYPEAAIRIDDEGSVVIEEYDGEPGQLKDVKKQR